MRIAVVGLGKMGLSHFAIVNAHPDTETVACEQPGFLADVLRKQLPRTTIHSNYEQMLDTAGLDAVIIATPSSLHGTMVRAALDRGIHVFCEKPFCLDWREAEELSAVAEAKGLINQVGYHYRYVGAFRRMKEIAASGALGQITHVKAEAYGPVVLRPSKQSWRTKKLQGGGCLYDYAAHPLNLLNWIFGAPEHVAGSALLPIFSTETDDQVMSTLSFPEGVLAQVSVNWSDDSYRKMYTRIEMIGTRGRVNADRQECQTYLREEHPALPGMRKGWNLQNTTELTRDPWFYLRGEEYSAQIADFVEAIRDGRPHATENDFRSAAITDRTIDMIVQDSAGVQQPVRQTEESASKTQKRSWFFGIRT
ncbi:Gfo/Idh/MocA family protein [Seohaeicola saemankumensis]|uniref:Gfo/Idh/MocA family protein n=1 Tax=Seohaeicola saemankumensis TaxID=481181 RepID=A0ABW3TGC3_9RHOB